MFTEVCICHFEYDNLKSLATHTICHTLNGIVQVQGVACLLHAFSPQMSKHWSLSSIIKANLSCSFRLNFCAYLILLVWLFEINVSEIACSVGSCGYFNLLHFQSPKATNSPAYTCVYLALLLGLLSFLKLGQ